MREGKFIVLEGIDGSGTTTQAAYLRQSVFARVTPLCTTREPSDGPVGALIRQMLRKRVVVQGPSGTKAPDWKTMALLFAADRMDHLESEIEPALRQGVTVVCDRYYHSSVAYQAANLRGDPKEAIAWIQDLNAQAIRPDLTIVLHVDPITAERRRAARGLPKEIYETSELQDHLATVYRTIERYFPNERIEHVDGMRSPEEVHKTILERIEHCFKSDTQRS